LCLSALDELGKFNTSSSAILRKVESLAIEDANDEVRNRARELLKTPAYRTVRKSLNKMNRGDRQFILHEIEKWEADGLLEPERADLIKQRYNFDSSTLAQPQPITD